MDLQFSIVLVSYYLLDLPSSKFYPNCSLVLIKIWWILFISVVHYTLYKSLNFSVTSICIYVQKYRGFQQFFSGLSLILVFAAFNQFAQFVLHFEDFTTNVYKDMKYKLRWLQRQNFKSQISPVLLWDT